jgi:putative copper export protein
VLAPTLTTVRLGLHVLAAAVWVGGQLVLVGLLPTARRLQPDGPRALAQAFAMMAWPAYGVLVATGIWNISTFDLSRQGTAWKAVLGVKLAVVLVAGVATFAHTRASGRVALAVWGSIAGVSSIAALFMGILLAGP